MTQRTEGETAMAEGAERRSFETPVEDIEANYFAMCLLMPADFVRTEVRKMGGIDLGSNNDIRKLAKVFNVPETAMAARLGQLMGARIR